MPYLGLPSCLNLNPEIWLVFQRDPYYSNHNGQNGQNWTKKRKKSSPPSGVSYGAPTSSSGSAKKRSTDSAGSAGSAGGASVPTKRKRRTKLEMQAYRAKIAQEKRRQEKEQYDKMKAFQQQHQQPKDIQEEVNTKQDATETETTVARMLVSKAKIILIALLNMQTSMKVQLDSSLQNQIFIRLRNLTNLQVVKPLYWNTNSNPGLQSKMF